MTSPSSTDEISSFSITIEENNNNSLVLLKDTQDTCAAEDDLGDLDSMATLSSSLLATSISTTSPATHAPDRLLRKLQNFETTIGELMSLRRSTAILKEKLLELDELILDIPNAYEEMANEWRVKVAGWWKQYAAYSAERTTNGAREYQLASTYDRTMASSTVLSLSVTSQNLSAVSSVPWSSSPGHGPVGGPARNFFAPPKPIGSQLVRDRRDGGDLLRRSWPPGTTPLSSSTPLTYAQVSQMRTSTSGIAPSSLGVTSSQMVNTAVSSPRFGASPSLPRFPDANCYNAFTGPITKNSIRSQLETAFEQLTEVCDGQLLGSATYIDGMQKLLAAVAKAIKAIVPFVSDDQLLLEVSRYAIVKMPAEKQIEFNSRYSRKSLFNLMRFLRKEIVVYYEKFNTTNGQQGDGGPVVTETATSSMSLGHFVAPFSSPPPSTAPSASTASSASGDTFSDVEQIPYCVYCRHDGHRVHECPVKRGMLCFKCYEFGHTLKCCPNATLINIK